ncbi:MAG: histidine phosphatase family protein [Baekduiaceae bacterium]
MSPPTPDRNLTSHRLPAAGERREVVLVRHGETEWSRDRRHTGRTDIRLLDEGRQHVREALAPKLAGWPFALTLSSPLQRAQETAALAGLTPDALEPDLLEWDYGDYEGVTTAEIRTLRPDWLLWRDGCPGGEHPDDVAARCDRVIARVLEVIGRADCEEDVALVAHGHVLRVLAARWLEQPPAFGARLWLATGSLSVLGFERETRVIRRWNA